MKVRELITLLNSMDENSHVMLDVIYQNTFCNEPRHITQLDNVGNVVFLRDHIIRIGERSCFRAFDGAEYIVPVKGERILAR